VAFFQVWIDVTTTSGGASPSITDECQCEYRDEGDAAEDTANHDHHIFVGWRSAAG
jgi:hypothetical protein